MSFVQRVRRWVVGVAAAVPVTLATTGCVNNMTNVGNPHTDPIDALPLVIVGLPVASVVTLVAAGPCELSDDAGYCRCCAFRAAFAPFMVVVKLLGTATSPSIWWTAIKGEDWIGPDPWSRFGGTCEPTPPEEPATPPGGPTETAPPEPESPSPDPPPDPDERPQTEAPSEPR